VTASARRSAGYMLIEASAAYVLVVFAIVTLIPVLRLAIKANHRSEETFRASELAFELLEEVQLRRWDSKTPSRLRPGYGVYPPSALGADSGETATDKTTFDDIDDFNGYSESPPKDPVGNSISGFGTYTRSVSVAYVDSSFNVSASTTNLKLVTACATKPAVTQVCLQWLAANH